MNTKKKSLFIGLLLTMFGAEVAQAYSVKIINATPYTVDYTLDIIAGKDEKGSLAPGRHRVYNTIGYLTRGVRASVIEEPKSGLVDPLLAREKTRTYSIPKGDYYYYSPGIGNATFVIYGPYWANGNKVKYQVSRRKLGGL